MSHIEDGAYIEVVLSYGHPGGELATSRRIELSILPQMVMCGSKWFPGVAHADAPFNGVTGDIDIETICYAINEGREHCGTWHDDDGNLVRWRVADDDDLGVLRALGIVD